MRFEDKLDRVLHEKVERPKVVNEFNFLKALMSLGGKRDSSSQPMKDTSTSETDDEPVDQKKLKKKKKRYNIKSISAPTKHLVSYAVIRGKGFLRVGTELDKKFSGAKLHIFKKGERYHGFLVVPGPGGKRKAESFEHYVNVILETDIFEAVSDVVLKYESDDLGDLFDLSNYTQKSELPPDKFSKYDDDLKVLDTDAAEKADLGRLPWGKQQREEFGEQEVAGINVNVLSNLAEKYGEMAENEENEYDQTLYHQASSTASSIKNKEQLASVLENMKLGYKKKIKEGDQESIRKSKILRMVYRDFEEALEPEVS